MRIAIFTDSYPPRIDGIARVCELEHRTLEAMGHEVRVICPDRPKAAYKNDASIMPLWSFRAVVYEGLRQGVFTKKVSRQLDEWEPEIIRIHTQLGVGIAGLRYGRQRHIPIINTCHADFDLSAEYPGYIIGALSFPLILRAYAGHRTNFKELGTIFKDRNVRRRQILSRWLFAQFSNASTATTTPSHKIRKQAAPYTKVPLHAIGFGAQEERKKQPYVDYRKRYGIAKDTFVVISSTRLVKEKRVSLLIEGLAAALQKKPKANLVLLVTGGGPEKRHLQYLAEQLGVSQQVIFTGSLENQVIYSLLDQCDAYANASLRETFCLSACEAALAGLPLLMSDVDLEEIFIPNKNGLQFDTAAALGAAMLELTYNPALCKKLGAKAKQTALLYTPDKAVSQMLALCT